MLGISTNCFQLTPQLIKSALVHHLNEILKPIIAAYEADPEWQALALQAYPPPKEEKKVKKVKDKGDPALRAAAAAARKGVVAQPDGSVEGPGAANIKLGTSTEEMEKLKVSK